MLSAPVIIVGPQGAQGVQGAQGPVGAQGVQGDVGATGPAGALSTIGSGVLEWGATLPSTLSNTQPLFLLPWEGALGSPTANTLRYPIVLGVPCVIRNPRLTLSANHIDTVNNTPLSFTATIQINDDSPFVSSQLSYATGIAAPTEVVSAINSGSVTVHANDRIYAGLAPGGDYSNVDATVQFTVVTSEV